MSARLDEIEAWEPRTSKGLKCDANEYGFPTVIYRTPSRLVEECEKAFDAGLLLAALSLVVTIPDVCARAAGMQYIDWCVKYLELPNTGEKMSAERRDEKSQGEISEELYAITARGAFTASDLYQLRCAVIHAGSSVIEGKGEDYSPYKVIGVCVQGDARGIVASYGHTGTGAEDLKDCEYDCVIKLEGLISLMAKGVVSFLEEDPRRDCERTIKSGIDRRGVTDFRPLIKTPDC